MRVITVRNVPDSLYRTIVRLAKRNRRSIQQQAVAILERAAALDCESPVTEAAAIRSRLAGRSLGDTVQELREERSR